MPIKFPVSTMLGVMLFFCVASLETSQGLDIAVPEKKLLLANADTIIVCKVSLEGQNVTAVVSKVLKGRQNLLNTTVQVTSALPVFSFPLKKWIVEAGAKDVILVGNLRKDPEALDLVYGPASIWPRGAPPDVSKEKQFDECLKAVVSHQEASIKDADPKNNDK